MEEKTTSVVGMGRHIVMILKGLWIIHKLRIFLGRKWKILRWEVLENPQNIYLIFISTLKRHHKKISTVDGQFLMLSVYYVAEMRRRRKKISLLSQDTGNGKSLP